MSQRTLFVTGTATNLLLPLQQVNGCHFRSQSIEFTALLSVCRKMFARLCRGIGSGSGSIQSLRRNQNITSQWSTFSTDVTMTGRLLQLNDLGNISEATKKVRFDGTVLSCINSGSAQTFSGWIGTDNILSPSSHFSQNDQSINR
jgi:hypothetical protein